MNAFWQAVSAYVASMQARDWVAVYAAVVGTTTGAVQIRNAFHDRARLKLKYWWDRPEKDDRYFVVRVSNTGRRGVFVYAPHLVVAQHKEGVSRLYQHTPDHIATEFDWEDVEEYPPPASFELKETHAETYRYRLDSASTVLSVNLVDRAGNLRLRRRLRFSRTKWLLFKLRHAAWKRAKRRAKVAKAAG